MRKRVGRSRTGWWLLATTVAAFAVIRRFRSASPPNEPCTIPLAGDPLSTESTTVASRSGRLWALIGFVVLLLASAAGMGNFAWDRYVIATVQPPRLTSEDSEGSVTVYVPPDVQRTKPGSVVARMNVTPDFHGVRLFLEIHPRVSKPACVPYVVRLYGSARLASPQSPLIDRGVVIEGNTWRRIAEEVLVHGSACPGRLADGQDAGRLYGSVGWPLAGPTVIRHGSWTALTIPSLAVWTGDRKDFSNMIRDFDGDSPHELGTAYSAGAECSVDLGPLGPTDRLEAVAPPLDGPGLRWLTCEKPMTALLVSIPAKADADRALFWAGLAGGLAVSVFLLVVQTLFDAWLRGSGS